MNTLAERLAYAMELRGLGPNEVDRVAGFVKENKHGIKQGAGYASRIRSGQRTPGPANAKKLADALGVHVNWLLYGTGPMDATKDQIEKTGLEAALEASQASSTSSLEAAIAYWRHAVSDEAIRRLRAKRPAIDLTPDQIGEMLIVEQQKLTRELSEKLQRRREAQLEEAPIVEPAKRAKKVS